MPNKLFTTANTEGQEDMDDLAYDLRAVKRTAMGRGWTRSRLAEEAGLTRPTISNLFRGKRVTETTWRKVAEALGLNLQDLVICQGAQEDAA